MGKLELFTIVLQKDVYFPGDVVKGIVKIKVSKRFKINQIKIKLLGDSNVFW